MPVIDEMGYSDVTPIKQEHFRQIIKVHLKATWAVINVWKRKRWGQPHEHYHYYDINAGSGHGPNGEPGSPVIFLEEAEKANIPYEALFIEKDELNADRLKDAVKQYKNATVLSGDNSEILPTIYSHDGVKRFGMLYSDPNGDFDADMLSCHASQQEYLKMDMLINCNATVIKRIRKSPVCKECRCLRDRLNGIRKDCWIIREPYGNAQWSFLIGTQWKGFPTFKKIGFHKVDSEEGRQVFDKINYTKDELEKNGV